jgi:hypothetical protein
MFYGVLRIGLLSESKQSPQSPLFNYFTHCVKRKILVLAQLVTSG